MQNQVTIVVMVDTIAALSDKSLEQHLYVMDNSLLCSSGQGTSKLLTHCVPGQRIKWIVYPVDLQTPAAIKRITFTGPNQTPETGNESNAENLDQNVWSGYVPYCIAPDKPYPYTLEIAIGEGKNSLLSVDTLSLIWSVNPPSEENLESNN